MMPIASAVHSVAAANLDVLIDEDRVAVRVNRDETGRPRRFLV